MDRLQQGWRFGWRWAQSAAALVAALVGFSGCGGTDPGEQSAIESSSTISASATVATSGSTTTVDRRDNASSIDDLGTSEANTSESSAPPTTSPGLDPAAIGRRLADGDESAFDELLSSVKTLIPTGISPERSEAWIDLLAQLHDRREDLSARRRLELVFITARVLDRFAKDPVPPGWIGVLDPAGAIFGASFHDEAREVRIMAQSELTGLWDWTPSMYGGTVALSTAAMKQLGHWKETLYNAALPGLVDGEAEVRAEAVACMAALPIDAHALYALRVGLHDESPLVRAQTLHGFADRNLLLRVELILPKLHDPASQVVEAAESVLRKRGLSREQIGLGRLIGHPQPKMRISALSELAHFEDVDPLIWTLHLSRDEDSSVRLAAVRALADFEAAEAQDRLMALATLDLDTEVRQAAVEALPAPEEIDNGLPPLPSASASRISPSGD